MHYRWPLDYVGVKDANPHIVKILYSISQDSASINSYLGLKIHPLIRDRWKKTGIFYGQISTTYFKWFSLFYTILLVWVFAAEWQYVKTTLGSKFLFILHLLWNVKQLKFREMKQLAAGHTAKTQIQFVSEKHYKTLVSSTLGAYVLKVSLC